MNARIKTAIEKLESFLRTADDAYALPRDGAMFCHGLALAMGARRVLEIGTGYGYGTIWLAAALAGREGTSQSPRHQEGPIELITIDQDPRKSEAAAAVIKSAGLEGLVRFEVGHSLEVLERLKGPFDFVLNDADKEHCRRYVEMLAGKMAPRGVIVTDNISTHANQLMEFLRWLRGREDFFSTPVQVGNGMELTVKL